MKAFTPFLFKQSAQVRELEVVLSFWSPVLRPPFHSLGLVSELKAILIHLELVLD